MQTSQGKNLPVTHSEVRGKSGRISSPGTRLHWEGGEERGRVKDADIAGDPGLLQVGDDKEPVPVRENIFSILFVWDMQVQEINLLEYLLSFLSLRLF